VAEHLAHATSVSGRRVAPAQPSSLSHITAGDVLELLDTETQVDGRPRDYRAVSWRLLHTLGVFGADPPHTLAELRTAAQRSPAELIDRYRLTSTPIRDLLVAYPQERQPIMCALCREGYTIFTANGPEARSSPCARTPHHRALQPRLSAQIQPSSTSNLQLTVLPLDANAATVIKEITAPVIVDASLWRGAAGSARGAASFVTEAPRTAGAAAILVVNKPAAQRGKDHQRSKTQIDPKILRCSTVRILRSDNADIYLWRTSTRPDEAGRMTA